MLCSEIDNPIQCKEAVDKKNGTFGKIQRSFIQVFEPDRKIRFNLPGINS